MVCQNLQRYSEIFPIWGVATNFVLNYLLIPRMGAMGASVATLVYILLGMIGMPVFSKFQAGLSVLMGPTGGYILGYVPMVVLAGLSIKLAPKNRMLQFLGMVIATMVLYVFGTIWYMMLSSSLCRIRASLSAVPSHSFFFINMLPESA